MPLEISRIESRATAMLKKQDVYKLPVDVERLAECLGIMLESRELEDEFSGFFINRKSNSVIVINRRHSKVRQRFTIAHEIGHYALHRNRSKAKKTVFIDSLYFRSNDSSAYKADPVEEQEANIFAAELLMPRELIHKYIKSNELDLFEKDSLIKLADEFNVSQQAMEYRLKNLGLVHIG